MENAAENANNIDWRSYFFAIRKVCPWSWAAHQKGLIDVVDYKQERYPLKKYEARVYIYHTNPHTLKKTANHYNYEHHDEEWLWSHPKFSVNSTPVPCMIQQDRKRLESIRQQLKAYK